MDCGFGHLSHHSVLEDGSYLMYVALDELCLLNECLHTKGGDVSNKVKFSPENEKLILNRFTLRTDDPFVFKPKT